MGFGVPKKNAEFLGLIRQMKERTFLERILVCVNVAENHHLDAKPRHLVVFYFKSGYDIMTHRKRPLLDSAQQILHGTGAVNQKDQFNFQGNTKQWTAIPERGDIGFFGYPCWMLSSILARRNGSFFLFVFVFWILRLIKPFLTSLVYGAGNSINRINKYNVHGVNLWTLYSLLHHVCILDEGVIFFDYYMEPPISL